MKTKMKNVLIGLVVLSFFACGEGMPGATGSQGPIGPQGPAGVDCSALKVTFANADYTSSRYLTTFQAPDAAKHTFRLSDIAPIPAGARALYVELSGCVPEGSPGAGALEFRVTDVIGYDLLIGNGCLTWGDRAMHVWMPVGSDPKIVTTLHEIEFGITAVTATVRVLGWSE